MNAKELLELVTEDVIIDIMAENGSPVFGEGTSSDGSKYLIFRTICHGGDSHKLYYYCDNKTFHCYTCCGTMSVYELVRKVCHYGDNSFRLCMEYVANKVGVSLNSNRTGLHKDRAELNKYNRYVNDRGDALCQSLDLMDYNIQGITHFYDDKILNYFEDDIFYSGWIDEGISPAVMVQFGIRWYEFQKHIIIPHYNIDGKLVGIRRRSLNPDDAKNKYMPETIENITYAHSLGLNLYGLYENKEAIKNQKAAIIVEGEKSVLLSNSYFGNQSIAVATCGFNVSEWQMNALMEIGVEHVYLGFDKDFDRSKESEYAKDPTILADYHHYLNRIHSLGKKLATNFKVHIIWDRAGDKALLQLKDSPMDRGKDNFNILMQQSEYLGWKIKNGKQ